MDKHYRIIIFILFTLISLGEGWGQNCKNIISKDDLNFLYSLTSDVLDSSKVSQLSSVIGSTLAISVVSPSSVDNSSQSNNSCSSSSSCDSGSSSSCSSSSSYDSGSSSSSSSDSGCSF